MDTGQVIARFDAERQALAVMDHPNIAKVFDGGTTPSGRPYFVMELVRGIPITQYCDQNSVPIRERLELFATVCQAIQHAHTKGIIHRDIKPTNVLVTRQDGQSVVKVIDFGVAKAMGPVVLGEGHVKSESDLNEVEFEAKGGLRPLRRPQQDRAGGHTGWHSHPGINFFMVRAGTATEYHGDDPHGERNIYPAGTCLVRPVGHVHLLANEGNTDLELVAFLIIPSGARPRIDEPAP